LIYSSSTKLSSSAPIPAKRMGNPGPFLGEDAGGAAFEREEAAEVL